MTDVADLSAPSTGKREQTKQQNRRAILDAARQVFGELGYEVATVRDIIRRTNLSVGAFYNYYRSKEEVYEALSDDGARRFRPILSAQHEAATDFPSYLRGAITAYFNFIVEEHDSWRDRPLSPDHRHPHVRAETPEMRAVFDQVRWSVSDVLERGAGPKVDSEYLAAACIAIAREIGDKMLERRPVDVPAAAEFAVQMILGGLPALPRLKG
jgi:AcrR family transcriptional regulator